MSKIWETGTLVKDGVTYYLKDQKARELIAQCYSPSNPPPSTEGSRVWYATCSTGSGTGAKTATSSTGDFQLTTGAMVRVLFSNSNTAANPTISIDGSTAKSIRPISSASGMDYMWRAGEVVDIVYDGSNFVASDCGKASTSFYGVTKLDSSTSSTATDVAATPSAVKAAYDLADGKVSKTGDTMSGQLINLSFFTRKFASAPSAVTNYYIANLRDETDANRGGFGFYRSNTYGDGLRFVHYKTVNGNDITNGISMYISDAGTPAVVFGQPAAWRDGLSVVPKYVAGDTVSFPSTGSSYYQRFHGDWRYSYTLYFFIPLARSCEGLTATVSGTVYAITNKTRTQVNLANVATVNAFCAPGGVAVQLNWGSGNAPSLGQSQYDIASVQPYGFTITFS